MKELLENEIATQLNGYKENPKYLIRDFNAEKEKVDDYSGRELFELLQNAVDAINDSASSNVLISLQDNVLQICNNGEPFSKEGFNSLMYSNLSPKKNKNEYIGEKGLGFRSVLNWSETVRIYSGDIALEFSKEIATEEFDKLRHFEEVQNVLNLYSNHEITRLAILAVPRIIKPSNNREYVTIIELTLKEDVVSRVKERLINLESRTLLFLEKLSELIINCDGSERIFRRKELDKENEIAKIELTEGNNDSLIWSIVSEEGVLPVIEDNAAKEKQYKIMIAHHPDLKIPDNKLYSFFKTEVDFPLPVLVHGTFDLTADRNHLTKKEVNATLLRKICNKIVDLALSIAEKRVDYTPLDLLAPTKDDYRDPGLDLDIPTRQFSFRNCYYSLLINKYVFPTVNGTYISFNDQPKFYESGIAKNLSGASFNNLLQYTDNKKILNLIKNVSNSKYGNPRDKTKYSFSEITKRINEYLPYTSIKQRAALWLDFIDEYEDELNQNPKPNFVIDSNGQNVSNNKKVYFQEDEKPFPQPPEFSDIVLLNNELISELHNSIGKDIPITRVFQKIKKFNVLEYQSLQITKDVMEKLSSLEEQDNKQIIFYYEEYMSWLWKVFLADFQINNENCRIIARDGEIRLAKELFYGKEYDNLLAESLFPKNDARFVSKLKNIELNEVDMPQYQDFLSHLGVNRLPNVEKKTFYRVPDGYKRVICKSVSYPFTIGDAEYEKIEELLESDFQSARVDSIKFIEEILKHAKTKDIIKWFMEEERKNVLELISNDFEKESYPDNYCKVLKKSKGRKAYSIRENRIASYLRYLLSTSKWIEVGNDRFSPLQCLLFNDIGNLLYPIVVTPDLNEFVEGGENQKLNIQEVKKRLDHLGSADAFSEIDTDVFYQILSKLPEVDLNGELSRRIYSSILESNGLSNFDNQSPDYKKFVRDGKVFCKNVKTFIGVKDARYLGDRTYPNEVLKDYKLIDIRKNQNQNIVKVHFGIESLNIEASVVEEPILHPLNKTFNEDFNNYKYCAFTRHVEACKDKDMLSIKNLRIQLCSKVIAVYSNSRLELDDFSYLFNEGVYYLKINDQENVFQRLRRDLTFSGRIAEIYANAIDKKSEDFLLFLRSLYRIEQEERVAQIKHDFGKSNFERSYELLLDSEIDIIPSIFIDKRIEEISPEKADDVDKEFEPIIETIEVIENETISNENKVAKSRTFLGQITNSHTFESYNHSVPEISQGTEYSERDLKSQGEKAERYVYNILVNKHGKDNVRWVSENGGGKAGLGYDIEYDNNEHQKIYVEVKSTTNPVSNVIKFPITGNEIDFAKDNAQNYELHFVNLSESHNDYRVRIFPSGFFNRENENYILKPVSYILEFTQADN